MILRLSFAALLPLFLLLSCREPGRPEGTLRPASGNKTYGGIFRVNETGELSSLDPVRINDVSSAHIAENIYDNLVSFDENLNLIPSLAKRWTVSDDGLTYTYYLRSDAFFHDNVCFANGKGRRVTAHDVEYSFTRVCDARTLTKGFDYFRGKVVGADAYYAWSRSSDTTKTRRYVEGFSVVDDTTFQIRLTAPFAPFENIPALTAMGIHPREAVDYYGIDFSQHPVGSGPFIFRHWHPDRECFLERNPRYWQIDDDGNRLPYLEGVRFTFLKDDKIQMLEFADGNLEESYRIATEFFPEMVDDQKKPKGKWSKFTLLHVPAVSTQFYGMVTTDPVFRDKRIRQAFSYAIDRRRIIRYVLKGQAYSPAEHGLVPPAMPGYSQDSVKGYTFDPVMARKLLAEAGYPNGQGFPKVTLQLNAGGGRNVSVAEAIQGMLEEVLNIRIALTQVEFARHLEAIDNGQAHFFRLGWIGDYPDPETFLNLWYGKLVPKDPSIPSPLNSVRYRNPKFDELFEKALRETNRPARMALYAEAERVAMADAPMLMIFHDEDYRFIQPYVKGYRNNAMDKRQYKYVWYALGDAGGRWGMVGEGGG